jgi:hypothetical protein
MCASLAIHREAIVGAPIEYGLATATQDRDVERLHFHLLDDLRSRGDRGVRSRCGDEKRLRMRLTDEPLECPGTALLDLQRNGGQGDDPTEILNVALVREAGQIVLDTVVPGDERGGAREADGAVRCDQSPTG